MPIQLVNLEAAVRVMASRQGVTHPPVEHLPEVQSLLARLSDDSGSIPLDAIRRLTLETIGQPELESPCRAN